MERQKQPNSRTRVPEREKRLYAWITVIAIIVGGLVAAYTFMGAQGAENVMRTVLLTIASGALALLTAFIGGMAFFVQFRMSRVNEVISNVSIEMWKMSNAIEKAHSSIDEYSTEIRGFIGKMEQALTQHAQEFDQTRKQFHKEALALLRATESVMNYKLELSDVLETDDVARHMQVSNNMLTEWVGKLKTARDYEKIYWSSIFLSYMEEEQHDLANGILVSNMELYTTLIQKISTDLLDALPRSYRPRLIFVTPVCPRHFFNWPHQAQIFNRESGCDENYIFSYREDFLDRYRHTLKKLCNGRRVRVIRHVLALKKNVRKERLWEVNPDLASTRLEDIGVIEQSIRSFVGLAPTQLSVLYNTPAFETTTDLQQSLYDQTAYLRQLGISRNLEAYPIHNQEEICQSLCAGAAETDIDLPTDSSKGAAAESAAIAVRLGEYFINNMHSEADDALIVELDEDAADDIAKLQIPVEFVLFGFEKEDGTGRNIGGLTATMTPPFISSTLRIISPGNLERYEQMLDLCRNSSTRVVDIVRAQTA